MSGSYCSYIRDFPHVIHILTVNFTHSFVRLFFVLHIILSLTFITDSCCSLTFVRCGCSIYYSVFLNQNLTHLEEEKENVGEEKYKQK